MIAVAPLSAAARNDYASPLEFLPNHVIDEIIFGILHAAMSVDVWTACAIE